MPEYFNPNPHTVHLTGPDGKAIKVRAKQRVILSEYFDRYRARGFIKLLNESTPIPTQQSPQKPKRVQSSLKLTKIRQKQIHRKATAIPDPAQQELRQRQRTRKQEIQRARKISNATKIRRSVPASSTGKRLVVGRRLAIDATELLRSNLEKNHFPVSNNIGVGIMSYNRISSLKRIVESISCTTDLRRTTVFISDDASTEPAIIAYLKELAAAPNFVIIRNKERGGIAVNTNRLIRCMSRFEYGLILNDDVEVLKTGWDEFYVEAMRRTGMHHFQHRQPGVYGAKLGDPKDKKGIKLRVVSDRPQGAVMAFSREMLVQAGYFDESFGLYGMEHVDWSMKAWEFNLQEPGFHDVDGSEDYFRVHSDSSAMEDRTTHLKKARKVFATRQKKRCGPTDKSKVPEITYVIPFRNIDRDASIQTVVRNIRGQRFPVIHTIMVEQDSKTKINLENYKPIFYYLAQETTNTLFNKAIAFNLGVSKATTESVILHDADMVVQGNYTQHVFNTLQSADACHLGGTVIYSTKSSTDSVNSANEINKKCECERVVGYFEGGSLACKTKAYWLVGAFNEDYWGYGCEDCDFYTRLAGGCRWKEDRVFDFLHLWHGRTDGWGQHHNINKEIESRLKVLPVKERISRQHNQMRKNGYGDFLGGLK